MRSSSLGGNPGPRSRPESRGSDDADVDRDARPAGNRPRRSRAHVQGPRTSAADPTGPAARRSITTVNRASTEALRCCGDGRSTMSDGCTHSSSALIDARFDTGHVDDVVEEPLQAVQLASATISDLLAAFGRRQMCRCQVARRHGQRRQRRLEIVAERRDERRLASRRSLGQSPLRSAPARARALPARAARA